MDFQLYIGAIFDTRMSETEVQEGFGFMHYERIFETIYEFENGFVKRHIAVDAAAVDYAIIETIAMEKALEGNRVEILPVINQNELQLREAILKGAKDKKNPDLRINGLYVELKEPLLPYGKNSIGNIINLAADQANHVIVNIKDWTISEFQLYRIANGKLKQLKNLHSIEFRHRDKYLIFTKNTGS